MLIVTEGPDRVGKSTFVHALHGAIERLGRPVVSLHRGAPKDSDHPLHDYALPIAVYSPTSDGDHTTHSVITDRWHVGDLVYGPVYRGEMRQTAEMVRFTDALIAARGGVKVHMTADAGLVIDRILEEGEDSSYLKISDVPHVVDSFAQLCGPPWVTVNTTAWDGQIHTDSTVKSIVHVARRQEIDALRVFLNDSDYIGPTRPVFLVIAEDRDAASATTTLGRDTPARARTQPPSYAAFTPWAGSIGEYLIGCLIDAGWDIVTDVGLTNTESFNLHGLWKALGSPRVVTLGNIATRRAMEAELPIYANARSPRHTMQLPKSERTRYVKVFRDIARASHPVMTAT